MLEYLTIKQTLRGVELRANNSFIPKFEATETTRDQVAREELTKSRAVTHIKDTIKALETLFEACKTFLSTEPDKDTYAGCTLAFRINVFTQTLGGPSQPENCLGAGS